MVNLFLHFFSKRYFCHGGILGIECHLAPSAGDNIGSERLTTAQPLDSTLVSNDINVYIPLFLLCLPAFLKALSHMS